MSLNKVVELDERFSASLRIKDQRSPFRPVGIFFAHSGDSWFILLGLFLIWLLSKGSWHQLAAIMAASSIMLAVVVLAIKFSIKRRRPEGKWGAIYRNTDPHSFPSGHAARTAMLAVLAIDLAPVWLAIVLIIWAPLVSLARVWMGVHYLSDVVAGIILGILSGVIFIQIVPWLITTFPYFF